MGLKWCRFSLKEWNDLPEYMKTESVQPYYKSLKGKKINLIIKRLFDVMISLLLLIILSPMMIMIAIGITYDSKGGVFFRQERITQYGRRFHIHKFRTMVANAELIGSQITVSNDMRVTKIGAVLRKYRLDELPQLLDIIAGNMSFVGTRPETVKYVKQYTPEMFATLLLPAGLTSEASIKYKDESDLLMNVDDVDDVYVKEILPLKMKYNLENILKFNFFEEIWIMMKTIIVVVRKKDD